MDRPRFNHSMLLTVYKGHFKHNLSEVSIKSEEIHIETNKYSSTSNHSAFYFLL